MPFYRNRGRYTPRRRSYSNRAPRSRYGMRRRTAGRSNYTGQARGRYRPTARRFYYSGRYF